jgi:hypothetical protein
VTNHMRGGGAVTGATVVRQGDRSTYETKSPSQHGLESMLVLRQLLMRNVRSAENKRVEDPCT